MSNSQIRIATFIWFYVCATGVVLAFAGVWFMSPLGMGFAEWPENAGMRSIAQGVYQGSYFVGIPALLLGQVASLVLALTRRSRIAYYVPLVTIGAFSASVAIVVAMLGR